MDKYDRKLAIISQLDDDVIEKQTQRRISYWYGSKKKHRRTHLLLTIGSMVASLALIAATVFLLVPFLGKAVPIYTGMSVSDAPQAVANTVSHREIIREYAYALSAANHKKESPALLQNTSDTTLIAPDTENKNIYQAIQGQEIFITVHIDNPDSFEILSFTLNGKKYTAYMFEAGSDLENLIVKVNVGEVTGVVDYTIDAIKYVDGEAIKDVKMEGERTVQIRICEDKGPDGTAGEADLSFTVSQAEQTVTVTGLRNKDLTDLVIPAYLSGKPVVAIAAYAFKGEHRLTKVSVPSSVTSIGAGAFNGCAALTEITIPFVGESAKTETEQFQYPFGYIFGEDPYQGGKETAQRYYGASLSSPTTTSYYIPASLTTVTVKGGEILYGAFYCCSTLTTIHLPENITHIGAFAMGGCSAMSEILLPQELVSMGHHAFSECFKLERITLPDTLKIIGERAFMRCLSLRSILLPSGLKSVERAAFFRCVKLENITVEEGNTAYYMESGCLIEAASKTLRATVVNASIPEGENVTKIGDGAFGDAAWITQLTIPANIAVVDRFAFYNCPNLQTLQFAENSPLSEIGYMAFVSCTKLTTITLPDTLVKIDKSAFGQCNAIADVYFDGDKTVWDALGFSFQSQPAIHHKVKE